jgi:tRNA nucleotidyltransferase (CCA-adding enzyme)
MPVPFGKPLLSPELRAMLSAVQEVGRPRLVGGGVRDWFLGLGNSEATNWDVEVAGVDFDTLRRALSPFGATDVVGRSFGVIKVRARGLEYDFSLPRRESKTGQGHRGFAVLPDPTLGDADSASRRDFTLNAISMDPFTGEVIDPFGGRKDLAARLLRHTSSAFSEDPLRVLRAFQIAARFDFTLAPETAELCRTMIAAYAELPVERVWAEWEKWAVKSTRPSRGLQVLEETGWIVHFPEVAALRGTLQEPDWHPEGDVMTHTGHCLDALVKLDSWRDAPGEKRRLLSFAVLSHDFGKPPTTQHAERRGALRWVSPGHEAAGGPIAESFLRRIGAPLDLDLPVKALVVNHLAHHHGREGEFSDTQVRRLARRLEPATIDDLAVVMAADALGRPPLPSSEILSLVGRLQKRAADLALESSGPKPIVLGRHLISMGMKPGPGFRPLLDAAFEAQIEGAFSDEAGGLAWTKAHAE